MVERIIYCTLSCMTLIAEMPHTPIATLAEGQVTAVEDRVLLDLYRSDQSIRLLYFSRSAYEQAIRDLGPGEVRAVLEKRLQEWSPNAYDQMLDWIYRLQRRCLGTTAWALSQSTNSVKDALRERFDANLALLSYLVSDGRYDDVGIGDLLVFAIESEAKLISELRALDPKGNPATAAEVREHADIAHQLGRVLSASGRPEYAQALPYPDTPRAVFVSPKDDKIIEHLKRRMELYAGWRNGLVTRWRADRVTDLQRMGYEVHVLYYDGDRFAEDLQEGTPEQLTKIFERQKRRRSTPGDPTLGEYLNGLRLEQLLLLHFVLELSAEEAPDLWGTLTKFVSTQKAILADRLTQDATWSDGSARPLTSLRQCALGALTDTEMFFALANLSQQRDLAQRLDRILKLERSQLSALDSLASGLE